jgi:hypothetical protein
VCQRVLDSFALRVQYRFLGCNNDFCFHLKTECRRSNSQEMWTNQASDASQI